MSELPQCRVIEATYVFIQRLAYRFHVWKEYFSWWLSVHPSIICLSVVRSQRQQVQERNQDIPLPSGTFQLLLRYPEAFPGQKGYIIPPASPGSALGPPPRRTCPENLQRKATRRYPNQTPEPPRFDVEGTNLHGLDYFVSWTPKLSLESSLLKVCLKTAAVDLGLNTPDILCHWGQKTSYSRCLRVYSLMWKELYWWLCTQN